MRQISPHPVPCRIKNGQKYTLSHKIFAKIHCFKRTLKGILPHDPLSHNFLINCNTLSHNFLINCNTLPHNFLINCNTLSHNFLINCNTLSHNFLINCNTLSHNFLINCNTLSHNFLINCNTLSHNFYQKRTPCRIISTVKGHPVERHIPSSQVWE